METTNAQIDLRQIPVKVLNLKTRIKLSGMLNTTKIFKSPEKFNRDYRGLAELMGVASIIYEWVVDKDYVREILLSWENNENSTLGQLQKFFEKIDRYDVLDDTYDMFMNDARDYIQYPPILDTPNLEDSVLTYGDIEDMRKGNKLPIYDAFLLSVDADKVFADEIILKLESPPFNNKLIVKERDLKAGVFEHDAIMKLITDRCRKIIIILSDDLMQSHHHVLIMKMAHSLAFEGRGSKIVPCIYKECQIPVEMRVYHAIDYRRRDGIVDFWEKLHFSLMQIKNEKTSGIPHLYPTDLIERDMENKEINDKTCNDQSCEIQVSRTSDYDLSSGTEKKRSSVIKKMKNKVIGGKKPNISNVSRSS